jgi:hypothetical protein
MAKRIDVRLSRELDSFILGDEKDLPYWFVTLNNGETIYADDHRYGDNDKTIVRLKNYCKKNELQVKTVVLKFRSHGELALSLKDDESFFFRKKALGSFGDDKTSHFYLFGSVKDGIIKVQHWRIPELILEESDERDLTDDCEESIIWNYSHQ